MIPKNPNEEGRVENLTRLTKQRFLHWSTAVQVDLEHLGFPLSIMDPVYTSIYAIWLISDVMEKQQC